MIPITKPFLPPIKEYNALLEGIWKRNWLTNDGPLVRRLEEELREFLGVRNIIFVSSGTMALQISLKALGLYGEVITTPFSYVATTSSIVWEGCKPVFVDIERETFNVDPLKIEEAITPYTSALLFTHVYGIPCKIDEIQKIADKYALPVIYDAAHAFGSKYKGRSVFDYGDISITSFHSTKLFHTVEGGAIFTNNDDLSEKIRLMRNFGHNGPYRFKGIGINGKNSEFHAAMGLVNFNYISDILEKRGRIYHEYRKRIMPDKCLFVPNTHNKDFEWNCAYNAILLSDMNEVKLVESALLKNNIYTRRYFYPLLTSLDYVKNRSDLSTARDISTRVLCLPMYHDLSESDIKVISEVINKTL